MRVKLKTAVIDRVTCEIHAAGGELEVSEETAKDWRKRGIAEEERPPAPLPPAPPPKGKR